MTWREKPGRFQSMGYQRVKHNWVTEYACPRKLLLYFVKKFENFFTYAFLYIFSPQSALIHCSRLPLKLSCIILYSMSLKIISLAVVPHFSGFCNQIPFKELISKHIPWFSKNDLIIKLLCFRLHFHFLKYSVDKFKYDEIFHLILKKNSHYCFPVIWEWCED